MNRAAPHSYQVEVPLPPKPCSSNWRGHWGTRSSAVKRYKQDCYDAFKLAMLKSELPVRFRVPVTVHLDYYLCNKTAIPGTTYSQVYNVVMPRDEDNARHCFKAGQDAMKEIGLVPDDGKKYVRMGDTRIHSRAKEHKGRSCVVVTFEVDET